jgi:hypothetical protein
VERCSTTNRRCFIYRFWHIEIMEKTQNDNEYINKVLNFHSENMQQGIKLIYEGEITQSLTKFFAASTEKEMECNQEDLGIIMKVYHITIECMQNILKHSKNGPESPEGAIARGICIFNKYDNHYTVTTGNHISKDNSIKVSTMLDTINSLSKEELKAKYLEQLKNGKLSESNAGLGFLDIAKKTGNKLCYHIEEINEETDFFILKAVVNKV